MELTNLLVAIIFTYYTFYATKLFDSEERIKIKEKNNKLNEYREIPVKTLEQQKEFLNIKNPTNKVKFKFTKEVFYEILFRVIMYFVFINIYLWVFDKGQIIFKIWQVILILIFFPLFVNIFLEKFNLENSSLLVFFKGGNKKNKFKKGK